MGKQLTMMSDMLFRDTVDPDHLRVAASRAFGIAPNLVSVAEAAGLKAIPDEARVVMLRESQDMPGDFPAWYGMSVDPTLVDRAAAAVSTIARTLDAVLLTDAEDEQDITLHLPNGSGHVVRLEQGDDDAFRITPEMHQLIESVGRRAPGTGNSPTDPSQATNRRKAIAG
ncbi:MAG: hypothetical protein M3440_02545 [Chloroflexota bacterium]|nr:hypothetical protein [Chloroflexota bacterium]